MRIERLLLRDVGPFDDVTIEFPPGTDPDLADVYLLTGPNGAGKSTVLYALASAVACSSTGLLGADLLAARMRSPGSRVVLQSSHRRLIVGALRGHVRKEDLADLFESKPLSRLNPIPITALEYFGLGEDLADLFESKPLSRLNPIPITALEYFGLGPESAPYSRSVTMAPHARIPRDTPFDWAAFAYAGLRSVSEVQITAIQEPATSPLENSLSFLQTADTNLLANWIVSQNYRRLKAKEADDLDEVHRREQSIRRIEKAIADIVEDPSFGFVITTKDDDVRVRWRGATVSLGVLPAGLQSIVSWIADLLMRLDRIPWENDTPVEQRRFLLLLDEIDIHLHPAWQRRVLPFVQRLFPNAQIIATTHSPFVVGSLADGRIISLGLQGSSARVIGEAEPKLGVSYSAVLRSIFGIESEFDVDTEGKLQQFQDAKQRLLTGDESARAEVDQVADELSRRSEELREIIALERAQLRRQLERRAAP